MFKSKVVLIVASAVLLCIGSWFVGNYKYLTGEPVMVAGREYGICYLELTLNENKTFVEVFEDFFDRKTFGEYQIVNDTIFFDSYQNDEYTIDYGVIREGQHRDLKLYNIHGHLQMILDIGLNKIEK